MAATSSSSTGIGKESRLLSYSRGKHPPNILFRIKLMQSDTTPLSLRTFSTPTQSFGIALILNASLAKNSTRMQSILSLNVMHAAILHAPLTMFPGIKEKPATSMSCEPILRHRKLQAARRSVQEPKTYLAV
jgi:hypothetical protein